MRRSEAARYARWSAAMALTLASVTGAVYLHRLWIRHAEQKRAPAPTPLDVSRQSSKISFNKVEQNRVIFTVEASKSTDFKGQDASLLEDVKITIFGNTGERHDTIHTQSCKYGRANGGIECAGDVKIDLLSAADAALSAADPAGAQPRAAHVETRGVTFNRASGLAETDQPVTFVFPGGHGDALGMEYKSDQGTVHLLKNVNLVLQQPTVYGAKKTSAGTPPNGNLLKNAQEVHVIGTSLDFGHDTHVMHLSGPAVASTLAERLTAGDISLLLDKEFRAETLTASPGPSGNRPEVTSQGTPDQMKLDADLVEASFSHEGAVNRINASGQVHALRAGAAGQDDATADAAGLDLWPAVSQPKELNLTGNVVLKSLQVKGVESRTLQTSAFRMVFSGGKKGEPNKPEKAETLAAGSMEWVDAPAQGAAGPAKTNLRADRLAMEFGEQGKPRQLRANGNVQTERSVVGRPVQAATARSGVVDLLQAGGWSQMELQGDVRLKEADRAGRADRAVFLRAAQTATLTGAAFVRDATTETHAPRITFAEETGEMHAEGGVRSTDLSAKASAVQLAPAPANITAETLDANSRTGRALYTGHARLWQGESVLEGDSIELLRESRVLNAVNNVRAVFPQAGAKSAQLWHATCARLNYFDSENRAHLEGSVFVQSAEQRMRGPILDLFFTRGGAQPSAASGNSSGANAAPGAQQISRALGSGGVVVEEGARKAIADQGEYTAATGKFVMTGGNPTLYDGSAGTTQGRQLTFFLADDTIIVDSEIGSRTLTKHRVEK